MLKNQLCEMEYEKAIEIIKNESYVYVPWFTIGNKEKILFCGDKYELESVNKVIKSIERSSNGANVYELDNGRYIVECISSM